MFVLDLYPYKSYEYKLLKLDFFEKVVQKTIKHEDIEFTTSDGMKLFEMFNDEKQNKILNIIKDEISKTDYKGFTPDEILKDFNGLIFNYVENYFKYYLLGTTEKISGRKKDLQNIYNFGLSLDNVFMEYFYDKYEKKKKNVKREDYF